VNPKRPGKKAPQLLSPEAFPGLRSFFRGYFHQDMKEEYGSAQEAANEFWNDSSSEEQNAIIEEWSRFLDHTQGQPLETINKIVTGPLGSSYSLSAEDIDSLSSIFKRPARRNL